ncbi:MAG: hypothetical protein HY595_01355 [Candidatus Omnitrophica bacterium]|nr:hypothetical protein [Candidatus Omnitrophota bacterium]
MRRVLLFLSAVLIALLSAEWLVRLRVPYNVYGWTRQIAQETISMPSPTLGYVNRPGASVRFRNKEFDTHVTINSRGLRDREYPYEESNPFRIVVLGDSFAFGWGVEQAECVTEVLEERYLQGTDVINLSVSGYGTLQELRLFQEDGVKYHPDLVLVLWFSNDLDERIPEVYFHNGRMSEVDLPRTRWSKHLRLWLLRHSYAFTLLRETRNDLNRRWFKRRPSIAEAASRDEDDWRLMRGWLTELRDSAGAHGATLMVVGIPDKGRFVVNEPLRTLLDELTVAYEDLGGAFASLPEADRRRVYFPLDDHWAAYGHDAAARFIAQALRVKGLIPEERLRS